MAKEKAPAAPTPESPEEVDARGRLTVTLDETEYLLRPSREAIQTIERRLRRPLYELAVAASQQALDIDQLSVITTEFMKAQGKTLEADDPTRGDYIGAKEDRIADLIFEAGIPKTCARLYILLLGSVSGGYTASGEAKAAALRAG